MISEQEATAKRRAKRAKAMAYDNWAEVYGKDVTYLLTQLYRTRKYVQHLAGCERYSSTVFDTPHGPGVRAPGDCTCSLDKLEK